MQKESIIVTPNHRLASYLQSRSCSVPIKENLTTWRSEKILPLTTWLINCWQKYSGSQALLSSYQERSLWQQIIEEILGKEFSSITDTVIKAHELLINWQLDITNWTNYESENVIIFKRLHDKFKEYCTKKNLVTTYQLPSLLLPHLQHQGLKIVFVGFDEYPPQLKTFIDTLKKSNWLVYHGDPNNYKNSTRKKLSFAKQRDEITTIARFAKQLVSYSPKVTIGIVVANLTDLRPKIIRIFNDVLGNTENVNVSAGTIFSSLPIINHALELLALHEPFNLKAISKILLSPYIQGAETEKSNRAFLDLQLRQLHQSQFGLMDIEFLAKKYSKDISILTNALQKTQDLYAQTKNKKLDNSGWAKIFAQILQTLGWPGENNLTNTESMATKRFTELLEELITTSLIAGKTSYIQALQILHHMADHTIFQSQHETKSQINILGTLEAAGINFDYLWVMGLDQENWPITPTPNPFIPIKIQKKFALPHSSAERELHFCETLINRFKRSAKTVIFSYVNQIEDRTLESSALIADIPEISINDLDLATFTEPAEEIYSSRRMEELVDSDSLALAPNEPIHGSSRLIELQSLCPFRAFAEFRLRAKESKQFESGIDKLKRGILVHAALEKLWQKVKTHQNLCSLDPETLKELIKKSVEYALNKENVSQTLYSLEQKCLIRLLNSWLEVEKSRPPFQVIATEKTIETTLGSLQIKLRIDRIDRLANGNLLLIDYKTGKKLPTIFDWFGKRPKNPQLPLYCVAVDDAQSFAFAQINIESIKFKDISLDELAFGMLAVDENNFKNTINWHELIVYWREILNDLAKDFASGYALPEPLSPQVCKQCEFGLICRIV
ncbi:ATP-dependent helicase/nuclease subunit B [Gammaproteobacteria bacterium]